MSKTYDIEREFGMNIARLQFVSYSDELIECMKKLTKSALRAGGKVVTKILQEKIKEKKFTGNLANYVRARVFIDKNTGQPTVEVGYLRPKIAKMRHIKLSHGSPYWIEFGTRPHETKVRTKPKRNGNGQIKKVMGNNGYWYGISANHPGQPAEHILRNTAYENIDEIQKAEEKYLKKLNDKLEDALRIADEEGGKEEYEID